MTSSIPAARPVPSACQPAPAAHRSRALGLATLFGLLVIALAAVMIVGQFRESRDEPWSSKALIAAKHRLLAEPKNEALKDHIRTLDLELRRAYFRRLERNRTGAWLLLASGVMLVLLARHAVASASPAIARLAPSPMDRERHAARARATVLVAGGTCGAAFALLGLVAVLRWPAVQPSPQPTDRPAPPTPTAPVTATWPTREQLARNWPQFRGHDGSGVAATTELPLRWDVAKGEGVLWRAPLPLPGYNSPIVWENRVFLTGGNETTRRVFAFDATTGSLAWERPVTPADASSSPVQIPSQSGASASTAATDGERVFAIFGTGELGALDFEGRLLWSKVIDVKENSYGHAASLVVWQDRLFVQVDQGHEEDGKSALLALDTRTGQSHWTVKRPVGGSWTTPLIADIAGRTQLVLAGDPWLMAYDPAQGTEFWRAKVLGGELAPSPILAADLLIASCPGHAFVAVKPDGSGDVTATHVAWKLDHDIPDVPSPAVAAGLLFTASTEGHVHCRDAATGAEIWTRNLDNEFQASPLIAGDRVYLFAQAGNVYVIRAARTFEELATFDMGESVYATPAVAANRLLVRTDQHLFSLGNTPVPPKPDDAP